VAGHEARVPGWGWVSELVLHVSRTVPSRVVSVETKKHESCPFNCIASTSEGGARPPGKYYLGGLDWRNRCPLTLDVKGARQPRRGAVGDPSPQIVFTVSGKKQLFSVICSRRKKALRPAAKYKATKRFTTKRHRATILLKRDDPFYGGRLRKDMI